MNHFHSIGIIFLQVLRLTSCRSHSPLNYDAIFIVVIIELVFAFSVGITCIIFSFNLLRELSVTSSASHPTIAAQMPQSSKCRRSTDIMTRGLTLGDEESQSLPQKSILARLRSVTGLGQTWIMLFLGPSYYTPKTEKDDLFHPISISERSSFTKYLRSFSKKNLSYT